MCQQEEARSIPPDESGLDRVVTLPKTRTNSPGKIVQGLIADADSRRNPTRNRREQAGRPQLSSLQGATCAPYSTVAVQVTPRDPSFVCAITRFEQPRYFSCFTG